MDIKNLETSRKETKSIQSKTEEFVSKAKAVHGNRYNYSKTEYINANTKVTITCSIHGDFLMIPRKHLSGANCKKCSNKSCNDYRVLSRDEFLKIAKEIHGDSADFSKVEPFKKVLDKVTIICPVHGERLQSVQSILKGRGCFQCMHRTKKQVRASTKFDNNYFVNKAIKVHGNIYNYSLVDYKDSVSKVQIICSKHGVFEQSPREHLYGNGCRKCSYDGLSLNNRRDAEEFFKVAAEIHANRYDYSKVEYKNNTSKVTIICPDHGDFEQNPKHHLRGQGCSRCTVSAPQLEVENFITSLGFEVESCNRSLLEGLELDIYIPKLNVAFEIDGVYWHGITSRNRMGYERKKQVLANSKGTRMLRFWDVELTNKREIVESMIKNSIGLSTKVHARKCVVTQITTEQTREFFENNHIKGYVSSSVNIGLFCRDELISAMSFVRNPKYEWEIQRFANLLGYNVAGGASKMFAYFVRLKNPRSVFTYADLRYSTGVVYDRLGFKYIEDTKIGYQYTKSGVIYSRQKFQKHKLPNLLKNFDPTKSETENMLEHGYLKIYDSGHAKYLWTDNEYSTPS